MLGIILIINIFLTFNLSRELNESSEDLKEKLRPAKIELSIIKNSKCSDCFDISQVLSNIKKSNVNVTNEINFEFDSKEGKDIIKKHKIEKIPTVIATGEINKANIQGLEKKENSLLLTNIKAPYTNATSGRVEGRVTLYNLKDLGCDKCSNLISLINQIKLAGAKIFEEKNISINSSDGKGLIKKYKIDFAAALILSKELEFYETVKQAWPQIGTKENDGNFVLRTPNPVFINLSNGQLRGLVSITYITDKDCAECFDVNTYKKVLEDPKGFAVKLDKEQRLDVNDPKGKELIAKYNITQVPTVILSDEINVYPSMQALKQFFSVEKDNYYVFRKVQLLGTYKDILNHKVVKKLSAKSAG